MNVVFPSGQPTFKDFSRLSVVRELLVLLTLVATLMASGPSRAAAFDLQFELVDPGGLFSADDRSTLDSALIHVERMWETVITGYQPDISGTPIMISINPATSGLASASYSGRKNEGVYWLPTGG